MTKAEIKREINELRGEWTMMDEMIELSGVHGWEDAIEIVHEKMKEIEIKIDNLREQL